MVWQKLKKKKRLLNSPQCATFAGGVIVVTSMAFKFSEGPMGGEIRLVFLVQNLSFSLDGLGWGLTLWPLGFGACCMLLALGEFCVGQRTAELWRWWSLFGLLLGLWGIQILLFAVRWSDALRGPLAGQVQAICDAVFTIAAVGYVLAPFLRVAHSKKSSYALQMALALLVFVHFGYPFAERLIAIASGHADAAVGLGFYLLVLGNALLFVACFLKRERTLPGE